jgi:hypothetical protein
VVEAIRSLGLLILCALSSCTNQEAQRPAEPKQPPQAEPPVADPNWTVDDPGSMAPGPGERCEQLTGTCEAYCTERDRGIPLGRPPALTAEQATQLGLIVFRQTLATRATWILLDGTSQGGAPAIDADVLRRLEQQYRVFHREADLPGDFVRRQGSWVGYEQGYRFRYQLDFLESSRVRVWVKSTYGNWGCDFYYRVYRWEGSEWRKVCASPNIADC